jgi:hypothetical protein
MADPISIHSLPPGAQRRRWLRCAAASLLAASVLGGAPQAGAQPGEGKPARTGAKGKPTEVRWEELVPKDWDPGKRFRDRNLQGLSDSDPKVQQLMRELREEWDNAPTRAELEGAVLRIPGYLVPLEESKGELSEFLLVPYFGACIHSPPPPANQIVHVLPAKAVKGFRSMDAVWVTGTLRTQRQESSMGVSGYRLEATSVEKYSASSR